MRFNKSLYDWCIENDRKDILKEWDYDKNEVSPKDIGFSSSKEVWWICQKLSHSWKTKVSSRTNKGFNCIYCGNRKVLKGFNDLESKYPQIAKEWHPTKNGDLKPTDVVCGTNKKVWWQCSKNPEHEWESAINNRTRLNRSCPICKNQKVLKGHNDLATTHPEIAKEWHPTKNGDLTPYDVTYGCSKKVWWLCSNEHEWEMFVKERTKKNSVKKGSCPICHKRLNVSQPEKTVFFYISKIFKDAIPNYIFSKKHKYELDVYIPSLRLGIEYDGTYAHKDKSKDLIKDKVVKQNDIKLIRIIEIKNNKMPKFEKSKEVKYYYVRYGYCNDLAKCILDILRYIEKSFDISDEIKTKCNNIDIDIDRDYIDILSLMQLKLINNNLAIASKELVQQWHPTKNGDLKPEMFTPNSHRIVWWQCINHKEHVFKLDISAKFNRDNKYHCPYCSNKKVFKGFNDLASQRPEVAKHWDYDKNGDLRPDEFYYNSYTKVYFKCECGHEWFGRIRSKNICAKCENKIDR